MSLTRLAIERNRVTLVALVLVLVGGVLAYLRMPRSYDPEFTIRTAVVVTLFPGASPERVEQLVTDKLEKVIQEMPELDVLRSQSATGVSVVWVDIKTEFFEMRPIWDKLRRKVDKARSELPEGIIGPTVDDEFGDVFGILIGITGDEGEFEYRELKKIADDVRDELLFIDEIAKIEIYGAQEERIFVEYNNARLSELSLSPMQLRRILEAQNIIIPGGDIRTEYEQIVLEPSGNFESFDEVKRALIQLPGSRQLIKLEDVASLERGYIDPPKTKMRASGARCLGLAVSMREGGNIITLGRDVREAIDRLEGDYPIGVEFDLLQFQPDAVERKIDEFAFNLYQAVALVAAVMLLTLGIRTGLVVASLIPMAILSSFVVMSLLDIGLDQMSLAALIIALGMLVDNAIVMSESIMVRIGAGQLPLQAAVDASTELRVPLLTSSLTTAAAFLPIYLAESEAGEYTAPIFKVVTITLLCSWVLALTMVPMLCVRYLRVKPVKDARFASGFYTRYRGLLLVCLRHRTLALLGVVGILALAVAGFRFVPFIFFPPNEQPTFTAEIELPVGTPITRTETVATRFDEFIRDNLTAGPERAEGVTNWATFIGQGAPRFILVFSPEQERPEYAILVINTTSRDAVDTAIADLEQFANAGFPDLKATIRPLDVGPPAWPPIQVRLSGRDPDKLFRIVDEVKAELRRMPGPKLIDDDWGARSKKLLVRVNQARARRAGVTNQDVAVSLRTFLSGLETTVFREDDKLIPVTLRSVAAERQDIDKLETLNVYAQSTGQSVPLKQIADVEVVWQPSRIQRYDRLKTVTVEAALDPGVTAVEVNAHLTPWLERQAAGWGPGFHWELGGEAESSGESNASIQEKLPIAALIIVLLLVGQFNSIRKPLIILLTIPLSIIGVVVGLIVARSYVGFMTLLGVISLAGIVINNAIVLIDRIQLEIDQNGRSPAPAVIEAAQQRLRPILLTTCTTVGGLAPLWIGGGVMYRPMAITIIFGLIFATALTLGVVPVLYSILFRVDFRTFRYD